MSCKEVWGQVARQGAQSSFIPAPGISGAARCNRENCDALIRKDTGRCLQGHQQEKVGAGQPLSGHSLLEALRCALMELEEVKPKRGGGAGREWYLEEIAEGLAGKAPRVGGLQVVIEGAVKFLEEQGSQWANDPRIVAAREHIQPRVWRESMVATKLQRIIAPRPMTGAEHRAMDRDFAEHIRGQLRENPSFPELGFVNGQGDGFYVAGEATWCDQTREKIEGSPPFGEGEVFVCEVQQWRYAKRKAQKRQVRGGKFKYKGQVYDLAAAQVLQGYTPEGQTFGMAPGPGIGFILPRIEMRVVTVPSEYADAIGVLYAEDQDDVGWLPQNRDVEDVLTAFNGLQEHTLQPESQELLMGDPLAEVVSGSLSPVVLLVPDPGFDEEFPEVDGTAEEWLAVAGEALRPGQQVLARRLFRQGVRQALRDGDGNLAAEGLNTLSELAREAHRGDLSDAYALAAQVTQSFAEQDPVERTILQWRDDQKAMIQEAIHDVGEELGLEDYEDRVPKLVRERVRKREAIVREILSDGLDIGTIIKSLVEVNLENHPQHGWVFTRKDTGAMFPAQKYLRI